jgi:hypothetical protein
MAGGADGRNAGADGRATGAEGRTTGAEGRTTGADGADRITGAGFAGAERITGAGFAGAGLAAGKFGPFPGLIAGPDGGLIGNDPDRITGWELLFPGGVPPAGLIALPPDGGWSAGRSGRPGTICGLPGGCCVTAAGRAAGCPATLAGFLIALPGLAWTAPEWTGGVTWSGRPAPGLVTTPVFAPGRTAGFPAPPVAPPTRGAAFAPVAGFARAVRSAVATWLAG